MYTRFAHLYVFIYLYIISISLLRNEVDGLKCIIPYENKAHSNHTQGRKCPCPTATVARSAQHCKRQFLGFKGAICDIILPARALRARQNQPSPCSFCNLQAYDQVRASSEWTMNTHCKRDNVPHGFFCILPFMLQF